MNDWKTIPLGELVENLDSRRVPVKKGDRPAGPYPYYGASGIVDFVDGFLFEGEHLLVAEDGENLNSRSLSIAFRATGKFWVNNHAHILKGPSPLLRFLEHYLNSLDIAGWVTGSAQPKLTQGNLNVIPIYLPSNDRELAAIARVLGALDDKIELNRRMNRTLEELAGALFRAWFVDFEPVVAKAAGRAPFGLAPAVAALFPATFTDSELGPIPQGWRVGKIQDCCTQIQNGGTPRRNESRYWNGGNIPWLASGEVRQPIITLTESFITEDGLAESSAKWVPANSTVIALYGATAGQVSFVSSRLTTNQAVCALIPKKAFAFFNYLTMRAATEELENKAVGSAQQNISKGIVEETQVILPPTHLIEQFTVFVEPLFDRWIASLHESRTLAALRDTLLPKLLSGELRVKAAENRA